jgi:hypothetical protein
MPAKNKTVKIQPPSKLWGMKLLVIILGIVLIAVAMAGCKGLYQSTENKNINFEASVYGFKVVAVDPATGAMSPTGEFGLGKLIYHSVPIKAGQPFYASYESYSLWSSCPANKTIIWVGRAAQDSVLTFEAVPAGMIKVSADGIKTDSQTMTVTPVVSK